jgi:phosphoribosylformylglycinamidine cyclo-ligase
VARNEVIDGSAIEAGDVIVGLPSSGIHSNGLTLARRVFSEAGIGYDKEIRPGLRLGPALLEPTRIYVRPLLELLRRLRPPATPPIGRGNAAETRAGAVHGIAHITGSGILNLPRLKAGLRYRIEEPLAPPPIFAAIEEVGNVEKAEMYRTFNMGMGLAIVLAADAAEDAIRSLSPHFPARVVGRVLEGKTGADVPSAGVSLDGAKF